MELFDDLAILTTVILISPFVGTLIAKVLQDPRFRLMAPFRWVEHVIYRVCRIDEKVEMTWSEYTCHLLAFNFLGIAFLLLLQVTQRFLPLNPESLPNVPWDLALNTAVSFVTNTNWQAYSGETTMTYLTQTLGLCVQNFLSAATGLAVLMALIRGLTRNTTTSIGNFWSDLTKSVVYIFLPLSIVFAFLLAGQGVIQNFAPYVHAVSLEGQNQIIPMGPAASQVAIKQLGTNGGGFFGANSAHPFENPTPFSNFLELLAILLIPAALPFTFGVLLKKRKEGEILFGAMFILLLGGLTIAFISEHFANGFSVPWFEGKELRFGASSSVLWSVLTTATSNGSVNAMISSLTPLAGGVALLNMMLGELVFGGVGCGLYGLLLFALLTVFLAGLMVGRTPEYLGKKIEAREIQMVILAILVPNALILLGSALSASSSLGLNSLSHHGPHGFSEILYAFSSAAGNNGSAFAGLNANTPFYNLVLAACMLIGRFAVIVPVLAIAGSFANKKISPPSFGTFTTDSYTFMFLLVAVILIVGALTFFPALALGPLLEHFLLSGGRVI